jgi:hypothetical protein
LLGSKQKSAADIYVQVVTLDQAFFRWRTPCHRSKVVTLFQKGVRTWRAVQ